MFIKEAMGSFSMVLGLLFCSCLLGSVNGIGVNWGTQSTHPLAPNIVVQMLRDNGFKKVKLFDADSRTLNALANTGIEVMVGIPNDMLATLASSVKAAENWVSKNVSAYISKDGVNIKYVAVGNEPFLSSFNGSFISVTYPALQNIQSALIKAGLSSQVKVTVPLNADVYASSTSYPSGGDFRTDIHDLMLTIVKFLSDNGAPFTVNIYPFISLYNDPNFPTDFAFFDGTGASSLTDNGNTYTNVFDANHDTLVWALKKNGYESLPIIVGEVGWPTDGDKNANLPYAQKFNQGFMTHVSTQQGTPMRPGAIDAYLFSLIDEDAKSIQPGNFERHWGVFNYDGSAKYQLNLGQGASQLVPAKNVKYLAKKWCIFSPRANLSGSMVAPSVSYACSLADCTSLGYGTSCGNLDDRGNISYAFNSYYQVNNQLPIACVFNNLGMVVTSDPSTTTCKFGLMIDPSVTATGGGRVGRWYSWVVGLLVAVFVSLFLTCI